MNTERNEITTGKFAGCVLRRLAGRNLLFSEPQQVIYEVDDVSAYVWCAAERGLDQGSMIREMIDEGMDPCVARNAVEQCLQQLKRLLLA